MLAALATVGRRNAASKEYNLIPMRSVHPYRQRLLPSNQREPRGQDTTRLSRSILSEHEIQEAIGGSSSKRFVSHACMDGRLSDRSPWYGCGSTSIAAHGMDQITPPVALLGMLNC
jgi:hypothetical protein